MEFHIHGDQFSKLMTQLDSVQDLIADSIETQKEILKALTASHRKASFRFKGANTMPLTLGAGKSDKYFLTLQDAAGTFLTALDPGETIVVVSDDPNTVTLTPDSTPQADPDAGAPPTVASGTVAGAASPAQPGVAIKVSATFNLSSGAQDATISDTVTVNAGARTAGILFEAPIASTAANKAV